MEKYELYASTKIKLLSNRTGRELITEYFAWFRENYDSLMNEYFRGNNYTEEDIKYEFEILGWYMINEFYNWVEINLFKEA